MAHDEALAGRLRAALEGQDGLAEKRMFGGLAFLLHGHMTVAASSQGGILVRVDPRREEELLARPGVEPMVMRGRPMTGWLRVAAGELGDDAALEAWVGEGVAYVRTLPPK